MIRIWYFLQYLIKSFHLHGIHSPFVFKLVNDVFRTKLKYYAYDEIESIRAKLLLTEKKIQIRDFGAGKGGTYQKSIKEVCQRSTQKADFAQIIHRLVIEHKPKRILEFGTSLGISTAYLAKAAPAAKIISLEGAEELAKIADINLKKLAIHNVKLSVGPFSDTAQDALKELNNIDLVYFDGNHSYAPTLSYFHQCLDFKNEASVFIFDDIYWSSEMKKAWKEIIAHPEVALSIDLFQIGIVYFDKSLSPGKYSVYHSANLNLF